MWFVILVHLLLCENYVINAMVTIAYFLERDDYVLLFIYLFVCLFIYLFIYSLFNVDVIYL